MITEQQLTEWEELARAAGDDPLLNTICKAIANKSVGDPHAIDTHGNQRWTWFLEHADEFLALFKYRPEVALLAAVMTGAFSRTAVPALVERVRELEAENARLREATKWFVARAGDFDGIPPSKYFGDTDFQMRYPNDKEITVTLGQLRALRAAFGRQS